MLAAYGGTAAGWNMARLDLKFTFECNNRCVFCVQGDKREHEPDKSTAELREILLEKRTSCDAVVFTGGEVTLRDDLVEMVKHARDLGYSSIQIQTNGRRLSYLPYLDALLQAGVTEFAPALHGADSATHDELVCANGAFRQTVKGIGNVKKRGARVVLNTVIVQQNHRQLPAMVRLFHRLGIHQAQFAFVHALGAAEQNFAEVVPRYGRLLPFLHEALRLGEGAGIRMMTEAVPFCLMVGLERFVAERFMPSTAIVDGQRRIDDYADYRWNEGKLRGPPCAGCSWVGRCEGPWREYPERFGWDEFNPRGDVPEVVLAGQPAV